MALVSPIRPSTKYKPRGGQNGHNVVRCCVKVTMSVLSFSTLPDMSTFSRSCRQWSPQHCEATKSELHESEDHSSTTTRVRLKPPLGSRDMGGWAKSSLHSKLGQHGEPLLEAQHFARQAIMVIENFRTDVPSTIQNNKVPRSRQKKRHDNPNTPNNWKLPMSILWIKPQTTKQLDAARVQQSAQESETRSARDANTCDASHVQNRSVPFQRTCPTSVPMHSESSWMHTKQRLDKV